MYLNSGCICSNLHKYLLLHVDIDECSLNTDGCAHNCNNIEGSYTCSCRKGYILATDRCSCQLEDSRHNSTTTVSQTPPTTGGQQVGHRTWDYNVQACLLFDSAVKFHKYPPIGRFFLIFIIKATKILVYLTFSWDILILYRLDRHSTRS